MPAVAALLVEVGGLWARSGRLGGNVVVRCHQGHLFTTLWIPGVSFKSLRLGWWRVAHCPVGHHWSMVTPVREAELSQPEQAAAAAHDLRIP